MARKPKPQFEVGDWVSITTVPESWDKRVQPGMLAKVMTMFVNDDGIEVLVLMFEALWRINKGPTIKHQEYLANGTHRGPWSNYLRKHNG